MGLHSKCVFVEDSYDKVEFYYELTNNSDKDIFLSDYVIYEQDDLSELGLDRDNCAVYRSGRHKNDMPSVFMLGRMDEAMKDALSGMTETGDKVSSDAQCSKCIVSDHLTILGNRDGYVAIYFPEGDHQLFETRIYVTDSGEFVKLESRVTFNIRLTAGQSICTEKISIDYSNDATQLIKTFSKRKVEKFGQRNTYRPSVFCTWYYYGLTVTYEDVRINLEKMQERKLPFDVFQVDEGWEITLGEWEPNKKFPLPMKEVANQIKDAGYRPGIWTSPFIAHETATIWNEHPDWKLCDKNGNPCLFPMNDTVYHVLDITNPKTWDYFYELYRKLTFDWGYTYHKLDFTRAAVIMENAVYYDDTITLVEAYVNAVKAIRKGMGKESFFLMCGGLYDPIIGLVDAQRTGSDVLSMWSSNINKDGKTAPYTVKQSLLRYYMNDWWVNDPDALMVRKNETMERNLRLTYGLLTEDEVKTSTVNQYTGGGLVCSTEPLDKIDNDRLGNLRRIMPVVNSKVKPLDIMNADNRFPDNFKVDVTGFDIASIVRVNWDDDKQLDIDYILEDSMLPSGCNKSMKYVACDYYSGKYLTDLKVGDRVHFESINPHATSLVKLQPMKDDPIIVASTGHFSMGAEGIKMTIKDSVLEVKYDNTFDWEIIYTIMLPKGYVSETGDSTIKIRVEPLANVDVRYRLNKK